MNTNFPNTQPILSAPIKEPSTTLTPFSFDKQKYTLSISPQKEWRNNKTYYNTLPAAPREQRIDAADPIRTKKKQKYEDNTYYITRKNPQNVVGIFTGDINNDNFTRGNEFSNAPIDEYSNSATTPLKKTVNNFLIRDNPRVVSDSPFYSSINMNDNNLNEYPHSKYYNNAGNPIYTYPYNTLTKSKIKEHFENNCSCNKNKLYIGLVFLFIILLFVVTFNNK
jgi:hypothetical protein